MISEKLKIKNKLIMSKINIKPLADRVLLNQLLLKLKLHLVFIIPDTAKEKPQKGTVVAVGSGTKDNPITVQLAIMFYMVNMLGPNYNMKEEII